MTSSEVLELGFRNHLQRTTVSVLLALLIVWSFGLRLWYATPELDSTRFWDERYGLENLEPLLKEGQFRPVHGFHPGFSYLPHGLILKASDLLSQATGWEKLAIFDGRGRYTPTAYMICRTISVLFGTMTLVLLYLIGTRLGGRRLGLLAAFFLSVVPWHLRQSALFKADIALLFTVVLTFYLSLRAIERPSVRSFVTTGVAIGLALSSKFNAGPVAVPLTVGAFLSKGSKRRAFFLLVCAATISVAVFLALQPFVLIDPDIYRRSMGSTSRIYEKVAARQGHGRLYLFWHLVETLVSSSFHGPLIGCLALVGLISLAVLSVRHLRQSRVALPWLMALSYIAAYTTLYALATPRPSPHNWLPISPFAALGAAWAVLAGWLLISDRLAIKRARTVGVAAFTILVAVLAWQASSYTYRETVPGTGDRVLEILRARIGKPDGRHVVTEYDFGNLFQTRHRRGRLAIQTTNSLASFAPSTLDKSDAEVFLAKRLDDPASGQFYRDRVELFGQRDVMVVEPRLFRAWGPPLVVLVHPWKSLGESAGSWTRSPEDPLVFIARLDIEETDPRRFSIVFSAPRRMEVSHLLIGDQPLKYVAFRGPRKQMPLTTTRFDTTPEIRLIMKKAAGRDQIPFTLRTWRQAKRGRDNPRP